MQGPRENRSDETRVSSTEVPPPEMQVARTTKATAETNPNVCRLPAVRLRRERKGPVSRNVAARSVHGARKCHPSAVCNYHPSAVCN